MFMYIVNVDMHACDKYFLQCGCVHADLGLWILYSDLGQPSQTSDCEKNANCL
jgi:hypothetical protein